jgi:primosomal protein N' (replication factor Y)
MTSSPLFVDVILPFPLPRLFTYAVPDQLAADAQIGKRTVVQFGAKKYYTAIIKQLHDQKPQDYEVKEIISILDEHPVVSNEQLSFWEWVSDYYMCSLGEVMKAALPAGLKLESETRIYINHDFDNEASLTDSEYVVFSLIQTKLEITLSEIAATTKKNCITLVKSLYDKGAVYIEEKLKESFKAKKESFLKLTNQYNNESELNNFLDTLKRAPKQQVLIEHFIHLSGIFTALPLNEVSKQTLLDSCEVTNSTLKSLIEKGVFEIYQKDISRLASGEDLFKEPTQLNAPQIQALGEITHSFKSKDIVLLHGITSSGKTEIYIHLINEQIKQGKQVLYILPEIAITAQIINRLRNYFGNTVGIYHSKFSDNERVEIWNNLNNSNLGGYNIILGVRSSIYLPFKNLGLIIIDEEHENSFKQYDPAPRYNARDAAIVLARLWNAKVLLGSATPSYETYFNAQNDKYGLVKLTERYQGIELPRTIIVNTLAARKKGHMRSLFSNELLQQIEIALESDKQVILFQNRRGYAPFIECQACGWIPKCKHCDVTLTMHKYLNQMVCHYCGYALPNQHTCKECGSTDIQTVGYGTEKIEDELQIFFPKANIARMDLDSTRSKHGYENIIADFEAHRVDILVGTQMVTKGLDFENVSLVGILNADNMLFFPDFRAYERSFQLMSQVSGRAGRKGTQGLVVIQTSVPGNPVIQHVIKNSYEGMYIEQMAERKEFNYPPFHRLIKITLKHKESNTCSEAANTLATLLKKQLNTRVLGPDMPVIGRIQNLFLKNIIIKVEKEISIIKVKQFINQQITHLTNQPNFKNIHTVIDVDPL